MRSFEAINYSLRPNKNVERKLIASSLRAIGREFEIDRYRYVGFGSMWFTDFVLFHKVLGISDMVTIEEVASRQKRVEFNKPFACIEVKMQSAALALGDVIDDKPTLAWLDYDGPLEAALSGDIEIAVGAMSSGSMLMVSANAEVQQLSGRTIEGDEVSPLEYLEGICNAGSLSHQAHRLTRNGFPTLAAELIHARINAAVLDLKPGLTYEPIWTYRYADGVEMITVGGMIADAVDAAKLGQCGLAALPHLSSATPFEIDLPVLTDKEKRALDARLPCGGAIDHATLEFELRQREVDAYQRFYLEYPVFNELAA